MTASLLIGATADASFVHGVHGAPGVTRWTCFATRRDLAAHCEAVEWASVPPGGLSGEHRHTRTEEIYFIVRGAGDMLLNGKPHPVRRHSLVLTGVGTVHGLRNTGDTDLDWLVIETFSPATSAAVVGTAPRQGEVPVSKAEVVDMTVRPVVDTTGVFQGPLRRLEIIELAADQERQFVSTGREHSVFVLSGEATVSAGATVVKLAAGHCVTVPLGGSVTLSTTDGVELFVATLAVSGDEVAK